MSDGLKTCAAEGCTNILPGYKLAIGDTLCHEHGVKKAKRAPRKREDPEDLERFRRALLDETLVSLIRDPSRWTPEGAESFGDSSLRARSRVVRNRCPGWMCRARFDAPLPQGTYCSSNCKKRTRYHQAAFRRDLHRLRMGLIPPCQHCGRMILGRRAESRFCSRACQAGSYYIQHSSHAPSYVSDFSRACQGCGTPLSSSRQRRHARWCSRSCYQRAWKRAAAKRQEALP
jgi:hypothetical protein